MRRGKRSRRARARAPLGLAAVAAATALWAAAAAPALGATVRSGSLRADISEDPWRLSFRDADGRPVLSEHPATGAGPTGTLGFRAQAAWFHATRVLSARRQGRAYVAELATTHPLGRIRARLAPAAEGVIALNADVLGPVAGLDAVGIGFDGRRGERYLGFGERSNAVDQRGNVVENYVSDGPYQPEERPFLEAFVPPWGFRERDDATYFPLPWLLSTAGYGVLVDNPETSYFRLGSEQTGAWSLEVTRAPADEVGDETSPQPTRLSLRVFAGPKPADALRRFTAATGRQPAPAAPWYFGPWFQPSDEEEQAQLARLRRADAPLSVAQTYLHYLPCGDQEGVRAAQRRRTAAFHAAGVAVTTYFNPMICSNYAPFGQAAARGALTKNKLGDPYLYRYSTADQFLVGQFDFFAPAGRALYADLLSDAVEDGYDGWMEDFGEYTPLDSESAGGLDGTRAHNPYPTRYHCAAQDFARRSPRPLGRFQRSGWTGVARCAQIVWGGDPTTDWGFDGLASAVKQALSVGTSGISTWGSDIGGFFALGRRRLTPELLKRWVQFGAVSGVMRTQANGIALPPKERPQIYDPDQLPHWRRYTKLRTQLYPYIAAADAEYRASGLPLMRHLGLAFPADARARDREDELLFGPEVLAAPVLEDGARRRELYLPSGSWVDFWRAVAYRKRDGGFDVRRARLLRGGRSAVLPAPLEELPLAVRSGAILALLPEDVETLTDYGGSAATGLDDRRDRLNLLAFPRGTSSSRFYGSGRLRSRETGGGWTLGIAGGVQRSYRLQASMATLERPFKPCRVEVAGKPLPRSAWSYDGETKVLRTRFRVRSATLSAVRDCERSGRRSSGAGRADRHAGGGLASAAAERSADGAGGEPGAQAGDTEELPFTGLALGALLIAGLALAAAGAVARRRGEG